MKNLASACYLAGSVVLFACLMVYAVVDGRASSERHAQVLMASGLSPVLAYCTVK